MKPNNQCRFKPSNFPQKFPPILISSSNSLAVFTVICILRRMKTQLGLEAMLEYTQKYLEAVEQRNPRLKYAVAEIISGLSMEKIYKEAMKS